jgi:hypothetical protein
MSGRVVLAIIFALGLAAESHAAVSTNWGAETALPKSNPANMAGGGVPNTMAVTTWQDFGGPLAGNGDTWSFSAPTTGANHMRVMYPNQGADPALPLVVI